MNDADKLSKCLAFLTELARESDPKWAYANFETLGYKLPIIEEAPLSGVFNDARKAQLNYVGIDAKKLLSELGEEK